MMSFDCVLHVLRDGDWHNLRELQEKTSLPIGKLELILNCLHEGNFVHVEHAAFNSSQIMKAKLTRRFLKFLHGLDEQEFHCPIMAYPADCPTMTEWKKQQEEKQ